MPAVYNGLVFKTRLEAKWAAFFDLAGWTWWANPAPLGDWQPDFKVSFPCGHSECGPAHVLLVAVLPVSSIEEFKGHPCLTHAYGAKNATGEWQADGGAAFGTGPSITQWEISHGAGGGQEDLYSRVDDADVLWRKADALVEISKTA